MNKNLSLLMVMICWFAASTDSHGFQASPDLSVDLGFPYEAHVLNDNAPVRSGPAMVHYATDQLKQGDIVEVHRHDPGGWCAIRPPSGSFSLLPESTVELLDDNLARVVVDTAQAWVGTRLGTVDNPLWQVKLKRDEIVEIVGEVSWPNPEGHSTIWYHVLPPAGEFRWIQMSNLQLPNTSTLLPEDQVHDEIASVHSLLESPPPMMSPEVAQAFERREGPVEIDAAPNRPSADRQLSARNPAQFSVEAPKQNHRSTSTVEHQDSSWQTQPPVDLLTQLPANVESGRSDTVRDTKVQPAILQSEPISDHVPDTPLQSLNSGWRPAKRGSRAKTIVGAFVSNQPPNQFTAPAIPDAQYVKASELKATELKATELNAREPDNRFDDSPIKRNDGPISRSPEARYASAQLDITDEQQSGLRTPAPLENRLPAGPSIIQAGRVSSSAALQTLEMELTTEMVKKDPGSWNLQDILLKSERVLDASQDPNVKMHAARLVSKVKKCQLIRAQFRNEGNRDPAANLLDAKTGSGLNPPQPVGTGVDTQVEFGTTFDAYGWLNELVQNNGSSPATFVLQDDDGKITHHITGSPGLNLKRYLKSKIGVIGQRGYHQRLNLDHVTVDRVVQLRDAKKTGTLFNR